MAFVRGQLAADPICSFNPATGELTRRSGGVLPLPGYNAGVAAQPPYRMIGPVALQPAGQPTQAPFALGVGPGTS